MLTRRKQSDYQQQLLWNYYDSFVFVFNFHLSALIAHNFQSNAKSRFALWFFVFLLLSVAPAFPLHIYIYHLSHRFISNIIHFFFHLQWNKLILLILPFTFYLDWLSVYNLFYSYSLSDTYLSGMMKLTKCWKHLLISIYTFNTKRKYILLQRKHIWFDCNESAK